MQIIWKTIWIDNFSSLPSMHHNSYTNMARGKQQHFCRTLVNLDMCPPLKHSELAKVNVDFKVEVGYWASRNGLSDYKI